MTESNTFTKHSKNKLNDDLSKNHSKSVRYRLRVQQDKEAEQQLKEFKDNRDNRVLPLDGTFE